LTLFSGDIFNPKLEQARDLQPELPSVLRLTLAICANYGWVSFMVFP
jgi:hypothetical protein